MPSRTQSILLGGLVVGILSTSVLGFINILCCAGVIIGAMVGVWHYTEEHRLTIPSGQGAVIGALAGVLGAILAGVFNQLLIALGLDFFSQGMREMMMQQFGGEMSPDQMEMMQESQNNIAFMLIGTVFNMAIFAIFGAVGGAIGASVFQKGDDPSDATGDTIDVRA